MNWKMIPFTELPPIDQMTWLELNVRSALLGLMTGTIFSPLIVCAWFMWRLR